MFRIPGCGGMKEEVKYPRFLLGFSNRRLKRKDHDLEVRIRSSVSGMLSWIAYGAFRWKCPVGVWLYRPGILSRYLSLGNHQDRNGNQNCGSKWNHQRDSSQKIRGLWAEPVSKERAEKEEPAQGTHRESEKCVSPGAREGGGVDDRGQPCQMLQTGQLSQEHWAWCLWAQHLLDACWRELLIGKPLNWCCCF